jgi:hypothetical protein
MSYVAQDKLEESWKKLNSAEKFNEENKNKKAVEVCEDSLTDLVSCCKGFIDEERWLENTERELRSKIMNLKYKDTVSEKEVKNLILDLREKLKKAR